MKNKQHGFTLVEMIVGVTLSLILMVSVSVFVSGGLTNIFTQKKILEAQGGELSFLKNITEQVQAIDSKNIFLFSSGTLFHTTENLGNSHWMLLHQITKNSFLCSAGTTEHIALSQIYPFEGEGSDFQNGISLNATGIQISPYKNEVLYNSKLFTGSFLAPIVAALTGTTLYISDAGTHSIYRFDTTSPLTPGVKVIGETSFGENIEGSGSPLRSSLNSPTGLAQGENSLFIADTNNDRILRYDESTNQVEEFLNASDGLKEPTGLSYDDVRKSLFIVNSGKGEVLEYTSFSGTNIPNLTLTFSPGTLNGVNQLRVQFFTTGSGIVATPSFSGITTTDDFQTGATDTFDYYFSDFLQTETSIVNATMIGCTAGTKKYLEGNIPKKEIISCTGVNTGSLLKLYGNNSINFSGGVDYGISLQNIDGDFSDNKSYAVKLTLFSSGGIEKRQNYYPFFTKGDNQIITRNDNRLRKVAQGFKYPTGIYISGGNLYVYDFFARKKIGIDINGTELSNQDTSPFDFQSMTGGEFDEILSLPISSFQQDFSSNMLNIVIKYIKNFSCAEQSNTLIKTLFLKKFIEN